MTQGVVMDRITADAQLTDRGVARASLASRSPNYFAGAVLMPYTPFLEAAKQERYDIDVLGRRFRVGF